VAWQPSASEIWTTPSGRDCVYAQIAAICRTHAAALATRNTKDFVDTGIRVINPWQNDAER
jgi:predicted nucleic acid-binding protein